MTGVLVFVEHTAGEPDRALARGAGVRGASRRGRSAATLEAMLFGPGGVEGCGAAPRWATAFEPLIVVDDDRLTAYAPAAGERRSPS